MDGDTTLWDDVERFKQALVQAEHLALIGNRIDALAAAELAERLRSDLGELLSGTMHGRELGAHTIRVLLRLRAERTFGCV